MVSLNFWSLFVQNIIGFVGYKSVNEFLLFMFFEKKAKSVSVGYLTEKNNFISSYNVFNDLSKLFKLSMFLSWSLSINF